MLKLLILSLIPITSYAGFIIPDTRRDQTWRTANIAAASYLERNNTSAQYREYNYNYKAYKHRNINYDLSSISQSGNNTLELNGRSTHSRRRGSTTDDAREIELDFSYAYLFQEKLSLGFNINYSTEYKFDYYLGSVWKYDANTYFGFRFLDNTEDSTNSTKQYIIGVGQRYENFDYEVTFLYNPEVDPSSNSDSIQSVLGALSVLRLGAIELTSTYSFYYTSIDESGEKVDKSAHEVSLRPEYELQKNLYIGMNLSYLMSKKDYKKNSTNTDYTLEQDFQSVGVFLRSIHGSFQFYASYSSSDNDQDYSHRTSNDDYLRQNFYLKLSYLY